MKKSLLTELLCPRSLLVSVCLSPPLPFISSLSPHSLFVCVYEFSLPNTYPIPGKPVLASDAGNGYVDPSTLGGWVVQAEGQLGWKAGVMGWEFHNSSWIAGIYPTTTPPHHRNAASQPTSESSSSSHLNRGVAGALYYWAKYFCAASLLS